MSDTSCEALGHRLIAFILSPQVISSQIDQSLANSVIEGESTVAPLIVEKHSVTVGPSRVTSETLGVLDVTLPLAIRLRVEFPVGVEVYDFHVEVALSMTAQVTGPLTFFLDCAPVTASDVTIQKDELVQGLLNLEFFISGELKKKVAEEVNRILGEKEADRRVDLQERVGRALAAPPAPTLAATGT